MDTQTILSLWFVFASIVIAFAHFLVKNRETKITLSAFVLASYLVLIVIILILT